MRTFRTLFYCLCGLLTACGGTAAEESAVVDPLAGILAPREAGLPYPIYASYDSIAPLLEVSDDDQTYVINFWATWCQPCVEELPYFERLAAETDARVIMVSLDFKRDVRTKLKAFVEGRPFKLPVVALTDAKYDRWIDRVDPNWGGAIPVTVVRRGERKEFHDGKFASYEELLAAVTPGS
jgi:thiol-disulfide isomerase/thioredoxin